MPSLQNINLIDKLKNNQALPLVDWALADYLIKSYNASVDALPLLLHLSQSARAGHLCIKVSDAEVLPKPQDVWEVQEQNNFSAEEWQELERLISRSTYHIPPSLLHLITETEDIVPPTPLCRLNDLFYFQKYWLYEHRCLREFHQLLEQKASLELDKALFQASLTHLLSTNNLLPEQAQAIAQLENQSLTIICGGPGTGKTYTAGLLIKVFWNSLNNTQKNNCRIALAAPTGKAAAQLQKSLSKAVSDLVGFSPINATTIHSLLGLKSKSLSSSPPLINADLLVIDESSMIDIRLMSLLFQALKPGARLIMLGDPYQLPPIEAGSFFADMTYICKPHQFIELKKCLRSELKEIIDLAEEIKKGESQAALHRLQSSRKALHFTRLGKDLPAFSIQQQLWLKVEPYLSWEESNISELSMNHFRILSPLRKGPLGVDQLNAFFYKEILKKTKAHQRMIIPIIITTNDSTRDLYNGDVGFLVRQKPHQLEGHVQAGDYALFADKKIPALLLPNYEYAYCLSVHKSQGSEFNHLILLLPEGSEHFGRELIYTAITRARQQIEIWSQTDSFEKALNKSTSRLSRCSKK
ncbi:exodeoxyribonuclease V subunit alpha [Neochlamydia sp. AcF84]|uniref:exodeoxyribonuclease V subunit alpha n=1 Tax=Neochlamydia sp. AcF84 TaxID=2315858 RepID=UPI001409C339|nr:exodeoxyribonuclease V subunit alpha [Neochlamydia sp. AcF84]